MIHKLFLEWRDSLATGENVEATSEALFKQLRELAGGIVWNTLHRHDDQLVQDIVTQAFMRAKTFRELSSFGTWFYRLAYRRCLMDLRSRRAKREVFLDDLLEEPVAPDKAPSELIEALAGLRERLSVEDTKLVDLRLAGYTLLEIAAQRGWTRRQIDTTWKSCKFRIRKLLTQPKSLGESA